MRALVLPIALCCLGVVMAAGSLSMAQPEPLGRPAPPATLGPAPAPLLAEAPEPTDEERKAAIREYTPPKGIGGCVMQQMDPAVRTLVLTSVGLGQGFPATFTPAVAKVSSSCTGRPYSAADRALDTATRGAVMRTAVGFYFAGQMGIGQRRLDAAWKSASAAEKAPFLKSATSMLDPQAQHTAPTLADAAVMARRLKIMSNEPGRLAPVHQYFLGIAFSELAEAQLSSEGAQPP